ncbi:HECT domain-containing family protein [Cryptosporidium andersoni]|uniref:HECT domain-containing family protein n=1 Tax=Cryptosporidium andersoni TaxID=117008 RepID=A0A1J4MBD1_9CRYT|nr:HECT domain-containing family protein [Cryptosporidium andersoni]
MGISLGVVLEEISDVELSQYEQLLLDLASKLGTKDESDSLEKFLVYIVQNKCDITSKCICEWWERREKLFDKVDNLLRSHPMMLDDFLNHYHGGDEEKTGNLTMTSNIRYRIHLYLEKLKCLTDDEFSFFSNSMNWEEYISNKIQAYIEVFFLVYKYHKQLNIKNSDRKYLGTGGFANVDSETFFETYNRSLIKRVFEEYHGSTRICIKFSDKALFFPKCDISYHLDPKVCCNSIGTILSPSKKNSACNIPQSLDEIYVFEPRLVKEECIVIIEMLFAYIWQYYRTVIDDDKGLYSSDVAHGDILIQKTNSNERMDSSSLKCMLVLVQKILFTTSFYAYAYKRVFEYQLLELILSHSLQIANDIIERFLSSLNFKNSKNHKIKFGCHANSIQMVINNEDLERFESIFSQDSFFTVIISPVLTIINILSIETTQSTDEDMNENVLFKEAEFASKDLTKKLSVIGRDVIYHDICSISLLIRMLPKCSMLFEVLGELRNVFKVDYLGNNAFLHSTSVNSQVNESSQLYNESFSYGPTSLVSSSRKTTIVEFQHQYKYAGLDHQIPIKNFSNELQIADSLSIKYFWRVINIPNASHLLLIFDDRCSTERGKDTLEIFVPIQTHLNKQFSKTESVQSLRSYYTESICGKVSGSSSEWPKNPTIIHGNSMLVLFSVSTRINQRSSSNEQWGFRLYVQGHFWNIRTLLSYQRDIYTNQKPSIKSKDRCHLERKTKEHFNLFLSEVYVQLSASIASGIAMMLRGPIVGDLEKSFVDILHSLLFAGGFSNEVEYFGSTYPITDKTIWSDEGMSSDFGRGSVSDAGIEHEMGESEKRNGKTGQVESMPGVSVDDVEFVMSTLEINTDNEQTNQDMNYRKYYPNFYPSPDMENIEVLLMQNQGWGYVVNCIFERASIIYHYINRNHNIDVDHLSSDKKFLSNLRHDLLTDKLGSEKLLKSIRGYICCYLHHLGLHQNILQICDILNRHSDLIRIIEEGPKSVNTSDDVVFSKDCKLLRFIICNIINVEVYEPLLYLWIIGRQLKSWVISEKHKANAKSEVFGSQKLNQHDSNHFDKSSYDYWSELLDSKIRIILNIIPYSGSEHPTIKPYIRPNYSYNYSFSRDISEQVTVQDDSPNAKDTDSTGNKYTFYSNKRICSVLKSLISRVNNYDEFVNMPPIDVEYEDVSLLGNKDHSTFKEIDEYNISQLFNNYEWDELERLDETQIIKSICEGIIEFIKIFPAPNSLDTSGVMVCKDGTNDLSGMSYVLYIRRFRAIIRFEAYRLACQMITNWKKDYLVQVLLLKALRSLGHENPSQIPPDILLKWDKEANKRNLLVYNLKYCLFPHFSNKILKEEKHHLEVHYTDNLRGCGRKIELQVKHTYYRLILSLLNPQVIYPTNIQILRTSTVAYYMLKEMDQKSLVKSNISNKVLNQLTNCERDCGNGNHCLPAVFPGYYPFFLFYSIMCIRSSIWCDSPLRLSFVYSLSMGLLHSINVSERNKSLSSSKELWNNCELFFMGHISVIFSRFDHLKTVKISVARKKVILEYMKNVFEKNKIIRLLLNDFTGFDELFVKTYILQPSPISNVLCCTLERGSDLVRYYCIRFLWKYIPLMTNSQLLNLYATPLLNSNRLLRENTKLEHLDSRTFFQDCLKQIGCSFSLFSCNEREYNEFQIVSPPVILVESTETGILTSLKKEGFITKGTNSLYFEMEYFKALIILLRCILIHSSRKDSKSRKTSINEDIFNSQRMVLVNLLYNIIVDLSDYLNPSNVDIDNWDKIYQFIGALCVISNEYDTEFNIGSQVLYQELQVENSSLSVHPKEGIFLSNNPLTNKVEFLVVDKDKWIEIITTSYNNLKIVSKCLFEFPISYFIENSSEDLAFAFKRIASYLCEYLCNMSSSIMNTSEEGILLKTSDKNHNATILGEQMVKYIRIQLISMSINVLCLLASNNYLSVVDNLEGNHNLSRMLYSSLIKIGMIDIPDLQINIDKFGCFNIASLNRRFIQQTTRKNKYDSFWCYPIISKATQADILHGSPYYHSTVKLPTYWDLSPSHFYYYNERVVIYKLRDYEDTEQSLVNCIIANNNIPTTIGFYYFECKFTLCKRANNSQFVNIKDISLDYIEEGNIILSIGLYRDGCEMSYAGTFGSFAYSSIGELHHSCTEKIETKTENIETFSFNDIVGCGYDVVHNVVFFTKNGKLINMDKSCLPQDSIYITPENIDYETLTQFQNVRGQFKPSVWVSFSKSLYNNKITGFEEKLQYNVLVEGNFGQEPFIYEYINKLTINDTLSLIDEKICEKTDMEGQILTFIPKNSSFYAVNEVEFHRRTIACELHEIMGGGLFPLALCILALERCEDNLEVATNWLLENGFQELDHMQNAFLEQNTKLVENTGNQEDRVHGDNKKVNLPLNIEYDHLIIKGTIEKIDKNQFPRGSPDYEILLDLCIYKSWNIFTKQEDDITENETHFDITRFLTSFGPLSELTWSSLNSSLYNSNSSLSYCGPNYSNDIWFHSIRSNEQTNQYFQGQQFEQVLLNNSNLRRSTPSQQTANLNVANSQLLLNKDSSLFPGQIVIITSNIEYWIYGEEEELISNDLLVNNKSRLIFPLVDIYSLPLHMMKLYLRRFSKMYGVVWCCYQISKSSIVQFIDYHNMMYFFVHIPTSYLEQVSVDTPLITGSELNSQINGYSSLQQYIREILLCKDRDETELTDFNRILTNMYNLYPKIEYFKCITLVRNTLVSIVHELPLYINCSDKKVQKQTFLDILRLFKLIYGNDGPTLNDYSLLILNDSRAGFYTRSILSNINYNDYNEVEGIFSGFMDVIQNLSAYSYSDFLQILYSEYVIHMRNSTKYQLPIVVVESSHPYECNMDRRIDVEIKGCKYLYAIFDPLCDLHSDTLTALTISVKNKSSGNDMVILKKTARGMSGFKQLIPFNSCSVRFISSAQNSNKYGIKIVFVPVKYNLADQDILNNNNIHFAYVVLDLIIAQFKDDPNKKKFFFNYLALIIDILFDILYSFHAPKQIKLSRYLALSNSSNSGIIKNQSVIPYQNAFIHSIRQLVCIFMRFHKSINLLASKKSIVYLDYLERLCNLIYNSQFEQIHLATNFSLCSNMRFYIMLQLNKILFYYQNNKSTFKWSNLKGDSSDLLNKISCLTYIRCSLDLQVQAHLITELLLSFYDASIYSNNRRGQLNYTDTSINIDYKDTFYSLGYSSSDQSKHQNTSLYIGEIQPYSIYMLNGDFYSHQQLLNSQFYTFNICPWFYLTSNNNLPLSVFKSSLLCYYNQYFLSDSKNYDNFLNMKSFQDAEHCQFPTWSLRNRYISIFKKKVPLLLLEKLSEIEIEILDARLLITNNTEEVLDENPTINLKQFLDEVLMMMSGKLLILPNPRSLWLSDDILSNFLNIYSDYEKKLILKNPISLTYRLVRVLTREVILLKTISFTSDDIIMITNSPYQNWLDRVKLLWDLLAYLESSGELTMNHNISAKSGYPWILGWEKDMIKSLIQRGNSFDPRTISEYLETFTFSLVNNNPVSVSSDGELTKDEDKDKKVYNYPSQNEDKMWSNSQTIQLMREFLLRNYIHSSFQTYFWPIFSGTVPICDIDCYKTPTEDRAVNEISSSTESYKLLEIPSRVSSSFEMVAPCTISFWLYPLNLNTWKQTFSIKNSNFKDIAEINKHEFLSFNLQKDSFNSTNSILHESYPQYPMVGNNWRLIAFRGLSVATISFWITEGGYLGIIINSPYSQYPINLLVNNSINTSNANEHTASLKATLFNSSSAMDLHTTKIISNHCIYANQWYHIALTIGSLRNLNSAPRLSTSSNSYGYSVKLYINGLLDESKVIPSSRIPLISGDLPWIIGWPKYMRFKEKDNEMNPIQVSGTQKPNNQQLKFFERNIFLGQDLTISNSPILCSPFSSTEVKSSIKPEFSKKAGEPLFGLLANMFVVFNEWELEDIHDYIKNTYSDIQNHIQQIEITSIKSKIFKLNNGSTHSNSNETLSSSCSSNSTSSNRSVVHVFSSNWRFNPIVVCFNNIWSMDIGLCDFILPEEQAQSLKYKYSISDKYYTEKLNVKLCLEPNTINHMHLIYSKDFYDLSIPKLDVAWKVCSVSIPNILNKKSNWEQRIMSDVEFYDPVDLICSKNCICSDSIIEMNVIFGKEQDISAPFVVIRLKNIKLIFSGVIMRRFVEMLDDFHEEYEHTKSNASDFSNIPAGQPNQLYLDTLSANELVNRIKERYGLEPIKNNNSTVEKDIFSQNLTLKNNSKIFSKPSTSILSQSKITLSKVDEFILQLYEELQYKEYPLALILNHRETNIYKEKIGCNMCDYEVMSYCRLNIILTKRLIQLFISILSYIDIISPRPSIYKYAWLNKIRHYMSVSLKELLLSASLLLTEDSGADGRIRVVINRPKSLHYSGDINHDPYGLYSVFGQVYKSLENIAPNKFRSKNRPWYVIYEGEGGIDAGGLYRDCISHICFELQSNRLPLFILCPNSYGFGDNQYFFIPNPDLAKYTYRHKRVIQDKLGGSDENMKDENNHTKIECLNNKNKECIVPLQMCVDKIFDSLYRFVGRLMGIAIRGHLTLNLDFPMMFWKMLLNDKIEYQDIRQVDGYTMQLYEKLTQIYRLWVASKHSESYTLQNKNSLENLMEEFSLVGLTWTITNSNGKVVELIKDGKDIPVKIEELKYYCNLLLEYKTNFELIHATKNIRLGLCEIIPEQIIQLFTPIQLERLICGIPSFNINLLKQHTRYTGYLATDDVIKWFWDVLSSFTFKEQQMFLRFVWGRCRLPSGNSNWEHNMEIVRLYPRHNSLTENNQHIQNESFSNVQPGNNFVEEINYTADNPEGDTPSYEPDENLRLLLGYDIEEGIELNLDSSSNQRQLGDNLVGINDLDSIFESVDEISGEVTHNEENDSNDLDTNRTSTENLNSPEDLMLPVSHTCFFQLELPRYSSREILMEKLLYAITEGIAIDTDNRATDIDWDQR